MPKGYVGFLPHTNLSGCLNSFGSNDRIIIGWFAKEVILLPYM
jgi:hypothetical protein